MRKFLPILIYHNIKPKCDVCGHKAHFLKIKGLQWLCKQHKEETEESEVEEQI